MLIFGCFETYDSNDPHPMNNEQDLGNSSNILNTHGCGQKSYHLVSIKYFDKLELTCILHMIQIFQVLKVSFDLLYFISVFH